MSVDRLNVEGDPVIKPAALNIKEFQDHPQTASTRAFQAVVNPPDDLKDENVKQVLSRPKNDTFWMLRPTRM